MIRRLTEASSRGGRRVEGWRGRFPDGRCSISKGRRLKRATIGVSHSKRAGKHSSRAGNWKSTGWPLAASIQPDARPRLIKSFRRAEQQPRHGLFPGVQPWKQQTLPSRQTHSMLICLKFGRQTPLVRMAVEPAAALDPKEIEDARIEAGK